MRVWGGRRTLVWKAGGPAHARGSSEQDLPLSGPWSPLAIGVIRLDDFCRFISGTPSSNFLEERKSFHSQLVASPVLTTVLGT